MYVCIYIYIHTSQHLLSKRAVRLRECGGVASQPIARGRPAGKDCGMGEKARPRSEEGAQMIMVIIIIVMIIMIIMIMLIMIIMILIIIALIHC